MFSVNIVTKPGIFQRRFFTKNFTVGFQLTNEYNLNLFHHLVEKKLLDKGADSLKLFFLRNFVSPIAIQVRSQNKRFLLCTNNERFKINNNF